MGYNISSTFTIHSAQRTDMDMYICTGINNITNVINFTESVSVSLFVQGNLVELFLMLVISYCNNVLLLYANIRAC